MSGPLSISARARSIQPTLIRALRAEMGPDTIDFGLGQGDLPVGDAVCDDLRRRLEEPIWAGYTPNAGLPEARQAVADHVGVPPQAVMLTCGVQEGLAVAILGLCEPGDEVLVPDPGFPAYANLVRAAGAIPVPYSLRPPSPDRPGWALDPGRVAQVLSEKTRLVVLNNPSNPTGSVHDPAALQEVLRSLSEAGVGWVSDEIYEDYIWEGEFVSARDVDGADLQGGLVLSGLSKSHHLMGWRLGWIAGPPEVIDALTPLHQHLVTCAPRPAQQAAMAVLTAHHQELVATTEIFARRREIVLTGLADAALRTSPVAAGAFYCFLDVGDHLPRFGSTVAMARQLLAEEDVMLIPGEGFGDRGLGHLRLAFTIGGQGLRDGVQRLRMFLDRHRPNQGENE